MSSYLIERLGHDPLVEVIGRSVVVGVHGERALDAVTIRPLDSEEAATIETHCLFVLFGVVPTRSG
jgi:hypothetical protein